MTSNHSKDKKSNTLRNANIKVDKAMRDFSKEEFFVKKAEAARDVLTKFGVPKQLRTSSK